VEWAVATAAWFNVPTIGGDYAGRALPEMTQRLPAIHGVDFITHFQLWFLW
jgi:DUF917 family protein